MGSAGTNQTQLYPSVRGQQGRAEGPRGGNFPSVEQLVFIPRARKSRVSSPVRHGGSGFLQFFQEGAELLFEAPPAADGAAVNGLPYLMKACRAHDAFGFFRGQATIVPGKVEEIQNPPDLRLRVADQVFIGDIQDFPFGKGCLPVGDQFLVQAVIMAERAQGI